MKQSILFAIFVFYTLTFFGQVKTEEIKEIAETNLSKDQMWNNLKKSIPLIFLNKNYSIETEEKESGMIIIKWNSKLPIVLSNYSMKEGYLTFTLESSIIIEIKDNKFRYTVPFGGILVSVNSPSYSELEFMGETAIKLILKDMELIEEISFKYYSESMIWSLNEIFDNIIIDYSNIGRSEDYIFIKELKNTYNSEITNVKNSIFKDIILIDDF